VLARFFGFRLEGIRAQFFAGLQRRSALEVLTTASFVLLTGFAPQNIAGTVRCTLLVGVPLKNLSHVGFNFWLKSFFIRYKLAVTQYSEGSF
jgi:hypothetical protein